MDPTRRPLLSATLLLALCAAWPATAEAARAAELSAESNMALKKLYATNPGAKLLGEKAKAVIIFPKIRKAGFMFGAQGGDGAMKKGGKTVGYYRTLAASYGFQAGVQSFGYALFFMTDAALDQLAQRKGLEVGVGPSLVIVDEGLARSISTTSLTSDMYALVFDQKGLMGGMGIQGSKITRIHPK